jgi:hypothetical protein
VVGKKLKAARSLRAAMDARGTMHSSNLGFKSKFATLSLCLLLVTLWLCLHGYHGLTGDGQIYAFQAFARLHPQFAADLYLQNTSQDQFTLFSPLYSWCIAVFGLEDAARLLTLLFTLWFLAGAWSFAAAVTGRDAAWLAIAFLLIVAGDFGGSGVFRILDPFLTARLPAEALVIVALACYVHGMKRLSALLAFGTLFIHPLMALPGLLLIVCLWLPVRVSIIGGVGGVFATLAIALVAVNLPTAQHMLTVIDAPWLEVVRERSQFLFLQLWSNHDWDINAQPFISLGFTAVAVAEERIRKLCAAAALVGTAGLAVAFIGGLIGPVAILVQGQPWRWVWIAVFIGAVLVPFTALQVSRDQKCGPLCALLLVSSWTLPGIDGTACVVLASILWLARERVGSLPVTYFRWVSAALAVAIVVWILTKCWTILSPPTSPSVRAPLGAVQVQNIFALKVPAVLLGALVWLGIRANRTAWVPTFLSALLAAVSVLIFPAAFKQSRTLVAAADIHEFADWANAIPPTSTVLVAPPRDVGAFVWFTLGRPNYLAVDQSSGVVFSRSTALEVRRRSEVLVPLMDPNWKILTRLRAKPGLGPKNEPATRPLTPKNLIQVCADLQLGFVISQDKVGFDPLRHEHAGAWKDWNLYDCRKVRSVRSAT